MSLCRVMLIFVCIGKKTKSGLDVSKRQRYYDANLSISQ